MDNSDILCDHTARGSMSASPVSDIRTSNDIKCFAGSADDGLGGEASMRRFFIGVSPIPVSPSEGGTNSCSRKFGDSGGTHEWGTGDSDGGIHWFSKCRRMHASAEFMESESNGSQQPETDDSGGSIN